MGRRLHYRPGSFYRTDDRSGFPTRAEVTRKEWNGYIVDEKLWEPRQPQDLVRGVPDYQSVPEARPLAPNVYVGPIYLTLNAAAGPGDGVIVLQTTEGMTAGDEIGVVLDDGSIFNTVAILLMDGTTVTLGAELPLGAPDGNLVIDYRINVGTSSAFLETESGEIITTEGGEPIGIEG